MSEKEFKCDVCGATYANQPNLCRHKSQKHGKYEHLSFIELHKLMYDKIIYMMNVSDYKEGRPEKYDYMLMLGSIMSPVWLDVINDCVRANNNVEGVKTISQN